MNPFVICETGIVGLQLVRRQPNVDIRGSFERLFCQDELNEFLRFKGIRQVNRSYTKNVGTVRGMHYQCPPHAEIKMVTCLKGEVWDVAVDLRQGSPTFLEWRGEVLTESNNATLLIPEGFAHGFQTLTSNCELVYFHTTSYVATSEGALNALDPRLAIDWPKTITTRSERDSSHPMLSDDFKGIEL